MEKVQKTTQSIQEVGQPDQYGNRNYSVAFTDSTSGFFRCKDQNLFNPGVESTFYMGKTVGKSGKEYYKIERVEKHENNFDNSSKPTGSKPSNADKFICLSYAKDLFVAFNGKLPAPGEVAAYAEILYSEMTEDKQPEKPGTFAAPDAHQQAVNAGAVNAGFKHETSTDEDDYMPNPLPF